MIATKNQPAIKAMVEKASKREKQPLKGEGRRQGVSRQGERKRDVKRQRESGQPAIAEKKTNEGDSH